MVNSVTTSSSVTVTGASELEAGASDEVFGTVQGQSVMVKVVASVTV